MSLFKCCGSKIENGDDFKLHFLYSHFNGRRDKVNFRCPFCAKSISYYKNLPEHFQTFHPEKVSNFFRRENAQMRFIQFKL